MDKPPSMSVKEYVMRTLSLRTNIPLKTIEAVVSHQFSGAYTALKDNKSIEISGFGKFLYNTKKAIKKLVKQRSKEALFTNKLNNPDLTEAEKKTLQLKLDSTLYIIDQIKDKV